MRTQELLDVESAYALMTANWPELTQRNKHDVVHEFEGEGVRVSYYLRIL